MALSQLESMTLVVELPNMSEEQMCIFESMAVSNKFDSEGLEEQESYWNVWYLTPRVFEKEEEDRLMSEIQKDRIENPVKSLQRSPEQRHHFTNSGLSREIQLSHQQMGISKHIVVAHWDPGLYKSRFWPLICLFGISFGALHLLSWNTVFPTTVEMWLWRGSAFVSVISMFVFMHFEKVVLRCGGPLTIASLASPAFYLLSRIIMMGEVFAALRGEAPAIYNTYEYSAYWLPFW